MKVLLASSSDVSIPVLDYLHNSTEIELLAVITNPDKATGRGQEMAANKVAQWCTEFGVAVEKPSSHEELLKCVERGKPDLLITVAYGHILKEAVINLPKFGAINLHYSLLPAYRGAAPVQWAILNGEKTTGVSVFKLDSGMDTGPIYLQRSVEIEQNDTTSNLLSKLNIVGVELIKETLKLIAAGVSPASQSKNGISFAPKFTKIDGAVDWHKSAEEIFNKYRALSDNPGVFTTYIGSKVRLNQIAMVDIVIAALSPGVFSNIEGNLIVGTGKGALLISSLTPEGRKVMSGIDFYNGLQDKKVDHFG